MRRFVLFLSFSVVVCGWTLAVERVHSQAYPSRPIQLIIPIPAGGGGDVTGRLLADELGRILGTQVIVSNKPGAGNALGTEMVAKSKKDGYTLGYTSSAALVYAPVLNPENVHYDPVKELDPLGLHLFFSSAFAVQENSPWKTFADVIDHAKRNPGKIRVSTAGVGSGTHFGLEMIQAMTGTQFTHVPFKGGEAVITALLGGHVEVTFDQVAKVMPHVEGGKMRALLVTKKYQQLPQVPTITELGYKQDLLSGWFALFGPAGLPDEVKKVLVPAIEKAVKAPEVRSKVEKAGYIVEHKSPAELKKLLVTDYDIARSVAVKIGLAK